MVVQVALWGRHPLEWSRWWTGVYLAMIGASHRWLRAGNDRQSVIFPIYLPPLLSAPHSHGIFEYARNTGNGSTWRWCECTCRLSVVVVVVVWVSFLRWDSREGRVSGGIVHLNNSNGYVVMLSLFFPVSCFSLFTLVALISKATLCDAFGFLLSLLVSSSPRLFFPVPSWRWQVILREDSSGKVSRLTEL